MKSVRWFIFGIAFAALLVFIYTNLSESQKRYLAHIAKQIPFLPARYFV
jgi:hypothetical protein